MKFRKVVQRSIREVRDGVSVAAEINATVAGNVSEHGGRTGAKSRAGDRAEKDRPGTPDPNKQERSPNG